MHKELLKYIDEKQLLREGDKILVGVSGGIDSIVLLDLLSRIPVEISIAHCNFQLRGPESDQDEAFVKMLADKYGAAWHNIRFDTKDYADKKGISTQMAARELRYDWFEKIANESNCSAVAIAHNLGDQVETFHLNLARGTGLKGISGIEPKSGKIIRPLLWATRDEISEYQIKTGLEYREDSSNAETHYKRNYLRHEILPRFKKLNPSYADTINQNIEFFRQSRSMLDHYYSSILEMDGLLSDNGNKISIKHLKTLPEPSWFIYHYLSGFGFNSSQAGDISLSLDSEPGKKFVSDTHVLYKDRDYLLITVNIDDIPHSYLIKSTDGELREPFGMKWESYDATKLQAEFSPESAFIDLDKLSFPLVLRKWQDGDTFYPFGMTGRKKLSDFLIDNKIPLADKKNIWLLLSDNETVWVIGHRIDNRFGINENTSHILHLKLLP